MKVPKKEDIPHKIALYKLLSALLADAYVAQRIYFKGGTCASMLGYLDRFSVDLDFDILDKSLVPELRGKIHDIIDEVGYQIKDESQKHLQFFLKYREAGNQRSILKLEIGDLVSGSNEYQKVHLQEIDRYCQAQTAATMFANKLVALKARWEEGKGIAGRDVYDVHYFINHNPKINQAVIEDLRGVSLPEYLKELIQFVKERVSQKILYEDLNPMLTKDKLNRVVPSLKQETLTGLTSLSAVI